MSDLTSDQVDAITHAWLDLCAVKNEYDNIDESMGALESSELAIACRDSISELEQEFPFLLEGANE
jgi:hypothetical protein|tara:strand:- start:105 stop:302 length:198 start_codon:yes stop_codon:yes gene_type:complete